MATFKQREAFKEVLKGSTISGAMVKVGYAKTTASTTGKLTNTKGWKELMDKHLSDDKLSKVHSRLLLKEEVIVVSDGAKTGSHIERTGQPHSDAAKALDMAYKLKRRYESEGGNNNVIVINVMGESVRKYGIKTDAITNPGTERDIV